MRLNSFISVKAQVDIMVQYCCFCCYCCCVLHQRELIWLFPQLAGQRETKRERETEGDGGREGERERRSEMQTERDTASSPAD